MANSGGTGPSRWMRRKRRGMTVSIRRANGGSKRLHLKFAGPGLLVAGKGAIIFLIHMASQPSKQVPKPGILLVDDEPYTLAILRRLLADHFDVATAASGEEALQLLGQNGNPVRMVLLDLTMPGLSGVLLLKRLRALYPRLILVVMSGQPLAAAESMLKGAQPDGYVSKPVRKTELLEILGRQLEGDAATGRPAS